MALARYRFPCMVATPRHDGHPCSALSPHPVMLMIAVLHWSAERHVMVYARHTVPALPLHCSSSEHHSTSWQTWVAQPCQIPSHSTAFPEASWDISVAHYPPPVHGGVLQAGAQRVDDAVAGRQLRGSQPGDRAALRGDVLGALQLRGEHGLGLREPDLAQALAVRVQAHPLHRQQRRARCACKLFCSERLVHHDAEGKPQSITRASSPMACGNSAQHSSAETLAAAPPHLQ